MSGDRANPFDLTGKVAVVTGATRGLGLAAAASLRQAGASVVLTARRPENLPAADSTGGTFAQRVAMDVSDNDSIAAAAEAVLSRFGQVDILVNNAGMAHVSPFESTLDDDFRLLYETNLLGAVRTARVFGGAMVEAGYGRIINVGSTAGVRGRRFESAYSASKGAIIAFSASLAVEWARAGVTVNTVCPGYIRTEMNAAFLADEANLRAISRRIPMGRIGEPEDFGPVITFLASAAAGYITGSVIMVDGGTVAK